MDNVRFAPKADIRLRTCSTPKQKRRPKAPLSLSWQGPLGGLRLPTARRDRTCQAYAKDRNRERFWDALRNRDVIEL